MNTILDAVRQELHQNADEATAQSSRHFFMDSMPRTAFRYALEKLPKAWRAEAMKK